MKRALTTLTMILSASLLAAPVWAGHGNGKGGGGGGGMRMFKSQGSSGSSMKLSQGNSSFSFKNSLPKVTKSQPLILQNGSNGVSGKFGKNLGSNGSNLNLSKKLAGKQIFQQNGSGQSLGIKKVDAKFGQKFDPKFGKIDGKFGQPSNKMSSQNQNFCGTPYCNNWKPCNSWVGCYPWWLNYSYSCYQPYCYQPCYPSYGPVYDVGGGTTVIEKTVVVQAEQNAAPAAAQAIEAPAGQGAGLVAEVGSTLELKGANFGADAGQTWLKLGDITLNAPIAKWDAQAVQVVVPAIGLAKPTAGELHVFSATGDVLAKINLELHPAQAPQQAATNVATSVK